MAATGLVAMSCACVLGAILMTSAVAQETDRVPSVPEAFASDEEAIEHARRMLAAGLAERSRRAREDEARAEEESRRVMFDKQPLGTPTPIAPVVTVEGEPRAPSRDAQDQARASRGSPDASAPQTTRVEAPNERNDAVTTAHEAASKRGSSPVAQREATRKGANTARRHPRSTVADVAATGSIGPARHEPAGRVSRRHAKRDMSAGGRRRAHRPGIGQRVGSALRCLFRPRCVTGRQVVGTTVGAVAGAAVAGAGGAVAGGLVGTTVTARRRR